MRDDSSPSIEKDSVGSSMENHCNSTVYSSKLELSNGKTHAMIDNITYLQAKV